MDAPPPLIDHINRLKCAADGTIFMAKGEEFSKKSRGREIIFGASREGGREGAIIMTDVVIFASLKH